MTTTLVTGRALNNDATGSQQLGGHRKLRRDRQLREKNNGNAPKALVDRRYGAGQNQNRLNPFEIIDSWSQTRHSHRSVVSSLSGGSWSALASPTISSPDDYGHRTDSHTIIKPSSASGSVVSAIPTEILTESLLATQVDQSSLARDIVGLDSIEADSITQVPYPFYLSSRETTTSLVPPGVLRIVLNETDTFFIFEMPEKIDNSESHEGSITRGDDEDKYEEPTGAFSMSRKKTDAETQTRRILVKSRGTYLPRGKRRNKGTYVNNWLMHEHYVSEVKLDRKRTSFEAITESRQQESPKGSVDAVECSVHEYDDDYDVLGRISGPRFRAAALVMERLIAKNLYAEAHRRYNGLIQRDPCSLLLTFNYKLELLWKHECPASRGRPVMSFRWNRVRTTLLAVAYGPRKDADRSDGYLAIWCAKNPSWPGLSYTFDSPITDIDWSRHRPNWLALGFYDGSVSIIDVSSRSDPMSSSASANVRTVRQSSGTTRSAHWQVQWWLGNEEFAHCEEIYTANQDGHVYLYRPTEPDLPCTEIMRISRIEGMINGVAKIFQQKECPVNFVLISGNPAALLLCRHPTRSTVYFIGSEEGCIYRCSIDYFQQHIESFLAHDGPIYSMEFSPFGSKVFLTAGADWCIRIWIEGLPEPLITLRTARSCVRSATWSPTNSTVIASVIDNEICIWDIKSKIHRPMSITASSKAERFVKVQFAANGNQLAAADWAGTVHVYDVQDMPFPPYDPSRMLIEAIERALATKPNLLRKFKSLGRFP